MRHEVIYMSAADLGITEVEHAGLLRIKGELERGELRHATVEDEVNGVVGFNMDLWGGDARCNTVCCIGGWLNVRGQLSRVGRSRMNELFYPKGAEFDGDNTSYQKITPKQAARAISNFLMTGKPDWAAAVA